MNTSTQAQDSTTLRGGREGTALPDRGNTLNQQRVSHRLRLQLALAVTLATFGCLLIIASFIVPPLGIIDSSVLVATGEIFTFSGSLIGVDYHYKYKATQA